MPTCFLVLANYYEEKREFNIHLIIKTTADCPLKEMHNK